MTALVELLAALDEAGRSFRDFGYRLFSRMSSFM
jgi:hypothetical protein